MFKIKARRELLCDNAPSPSMCEHIWTYSSIHSYIQGKRASRHLQDNGGHSKYRNIIAKYKAI